MRKKNCSHPDDKNQSDGRTETIDYNIFKSGKSDIWKRSMKSQLVHFDAYATKASVNKMPSSSC